MVTIMCTIRGTVQRVGYRAYVEDAATKLALVGFVRNNPNGTVTVAAQGLPDTLREFIEYLHEGSILAQVDGVEVEWRQGSVTYHDFSVLH
jgi:acylphosphatase